MKKPAKYTKNIWSQDELEYLKSAYSDTSSKDIAEKLGKKISSVYNKAYEFGLSKSDLYKKTIFKDVCMKACQKNTSTRWKKGHQPINKGMRWDEYMSIEAQEIAKQTTFKSGHLPHNTKANGEISIRIDKRGLKNQFIRVSLAKWIPLSHYNWIQANGPIPKGHCIIFKDKNTMNANLDNLELISQADNCRRNSIMRFPPELRSTIKALGKLKKTIKSI